MLWQRVLTAAVLVPLVVAGVLYLDTRILAVILGAIVLLGAREMGRLAKLNGPLPLVAYMAVVGGALWLAWRFVTPDQLLVVQGVLSIWWILATVLLVARRKPLEAADRPRFAILVMGALVLVAAWLSIVSLHASDPYGPRLVLFLMILIWVADSGAYFAGRAFGKTKLSPIVSPGKTWAGAIGAAVGAVVSASILVFTDVTGSQPLLGLILLCVLVTAVSIGGDLWESRLKREAGVKDSGNLLPGHGGVLDRIDSLLAAAPVFALGIAVLGGIA
ncbi:phosphatidate cytidylyltransferase [Thiosocius teredinicola]|uniref:phosphatidate cytidylyltransferase n=1 Tax=Thiosocius teredinicola TaxID=1973002 RepID=UPI0009913EEB